MKRLVVIGLVAVYAVALAAVLLFRFTPAVYVEEFEMERRSLQALDRVLAQGLAPDNSDLAIGIAQAGLADALGALKGVAGTTRDDGLTLSVEDVELTVEGGYVPVALSIRVAREELPMEAILVAEGVVYAAQVETESLDSASVRYRVDVREVRAELGSGGFSFRARNWVKRLITSHIGRDFVEDLEFSIPLRLPLDLGLAFTSEHTREVDDGSYTIRYSMQAAEFADPKSLRAVPGVAANGAVWFLVSIVGQGAPEAAADSGMTYPEADLESLRLRMAERLAAFPAVASDLVVHVNRGFLAQAVAAFNSLDGNERTIHAELASFDGHLLASYADAAFLGRGGYSASFASDDALQATARISPLSAEWVEGQGLVLSGDVAVAARADIALHVDPFVGDGMRRSVSLAATATVPLTVSLDARVVQDGNAAAVFMGPTIKCERYRLRLESAEAKGFGVIKDELFGVRQATPWALMGPDTRWLALLERGAYGGFAVDQEYWIGVRMVPRSVVAGANGYRLEADLEWELSVGKPHGAESKSATHRRLEQAWRQQVQSPCPDQRSPIFLLAGQEIGT